MPEKEQDSKRRRRVDMEAIPEVIPPIPDTFENVIRALVQPVKPKPTEAEEDKE